jgi:thiamine transport system substrate-binding protein
MAARAAGAGRRSTRTLALAATAVAVAGCSVIGGDGGGDGADGGSGDGGVVRVVTHDSFALPADAIADFEERTGYTVEQSAPGDGGALVNQLILTRDSPLGDVAYGVDNTFASRALAEGVFADHVSPDLPEGARPYLVPGSDALTPIDIGDVCLNVDTEWFADAGIPEPTGFEDLVDPRYADLTVVPNPATSSPGLAMLVATVGAFGEDGYADYWAALRENGVQVVAGWSDAYGVDFSGSSGDGDRPIVLSYSTSPAFEVGEGEEEAPTAALLDTCFRQVEYAGVLAGAANPEGARAFVDFLLSEQVQAALPEEMYVYPVDDAVALPPQWEQFAPLSPDPIDVTPEQIDAGRDGWIDTWTQVVLD